MKTVATSLQDMTISGLNLIKQAISIHDEELQLVVANRRFQTMFDLPAHLVESGAKFRDIVSYLAERGEYGPLDDVASFVDEKVELALAFEPHYFERTRSNGTSISVEGSPLSQGGWVSVYTDITEIKRQEAFLRSHTESLSDDLLAHAEALAQANRKLEATVTALEEAKAELTASRERLALTNAMTPAHIAHVDSDGIYTYSNGNLPTVLPGRASQIVGQGLSETLGAAVWSRVAPKFAEVLEGRQALLEFHDDDSSRFVRLAMAPDLAADGTVQGAYILSTDVTEEVSARTALAHARRRELASQLTSGMAHDFSNLLTIILGQQARLDAMATNQPELEEVSQTIRSAANRGGALIESLSRLDSPRTLEPVGVSVSSFLDDVFRLAKAAVPETTELKIQNTLGDDRLIFDPGYAQDAILNLVLNASEAFGGEGRVTIHLGRSGPSVLEIAVSDNGPGFSEEALANALAPFYSTKGGKVGRGLGLPTAFDFAKASGGTLKLRNGAAGGAVVSLRIPYEVAPNTQPGLVLLVDDDLAIRQTVRGQLRRAGHAVIEASSVAEARSLVGISDLTHVVTDLVVGEGDTGIELAREISGRLPVIIITGLPTSDPRRQDAASAFRVLSKPFTSEALETAMAEGTGA